ncbi:MAG: hypothetical protein P4L81_04125 [Candidatus Pacebacteria bacterium]|nr:hypothetical protein [Candidatus Paceibacterota bacterium]
MAKDYFQDITPPDDAPRRAVRVNAAPAPRKVTPPPSPEPQDEPEDEVVEEEVPTPERSIRNINAPQRISRPSRPAVNDQRNPSDFGVPPLPPKPKRPKTFRWWPWIVAFILIVLLAGLALFAFRKTTVTVIPRSHVITFDQTSQFTAYPAADNTPNTIAYTLVSSSLQASKTVQAQGTQDVETRAQGNITVYNDYSTGPVKLIANTRFETPNGLIFRIPTAVVVPGKSGTTPGHISTTIVADQPGQQYNISAVSRFTVPGLQSTPAMFSNIYAQSTASTTGGYSGTQAAVDPTTLSSTRAALQSQLSQEAQTALAAQNGTSTILLPGLTQITYQDLPNTPAANGSVQINEQATIQTPVLDLASFTQALAANAGETSADVPLAFIPGAKFAAQGITEASSTLGTDPFSFQLAGTGTLVWQVDTVALASDLAGHDQNAFTTITSSFPGIQQAHARIEPFWKTTFPANPSDISVVVEPPAASQ